MDTNIQILSDHFLVINMFLIKIKVTTLISLFHWIELLFLFFAHFCIKMYEFIRKMFCDQNFPLQNMNYMDNMD